jgi:hypothetical protein
MGKGEPKPNQLVSLALRGPVGDEAISSNTNYAEIASSPVRGTGNDISSSSCRSDMSEGLSDILLVLHQQLGGGPPL